MTKDEPSENNTKGGLYTWSTSVTRVLVAGLILATCLRFVPESYAVCSKARNIYTVDRNNPRVECISVRGSRIVGVGSFGTYYVGHISHLKLIAVMQTIFNDFTTRKLYLLSSQTSLQGLLFRLQEFFK